MKFKRGRNRCDWDFISGKISAPHVTLCRDSHDHIFEITLKREMHSACLNTRVVSWICTRPAHVTRRGFAARDMTKMRTVRSILYEYYRDFICRQKERMHLLRGNTSLVSWCCARLINHWFGLLFNRVNYPASPPNIRLFTLQNAGPLIRKMKRQISNWFRNSERILRRRVTMLRVGVVQKNFFIQISHWIVRFLKALYTKFGSTTSKFKQRLFNE